MISSQQKFRVTVATASFGLLNVAIAAAGAVVYKEDQARTYMQYARASFCSKSHIEKWDCGDICTDARIVPHSAKALGPTETWQGRGYVAKLPGDWLKSWKQSGSRCIVAFRGSVQIMNWVADFEFFKRNWPNWDEASDSLCPDCQVHMGVAMAYKELRLEMIHAIQALECREVHFAGHSLGAALVTLAAFEVRASMGLLVPQVWTFGKLRIGNSNFVKAFMSAAGKQGVEPPLWRVVHYKDPVPRLPPTILNFEHEAREVQYTNRESSNFRQCPSSVQEIENTSCSLTCGVLCAATSKPGHDHNSYMNLSTENMPESCTVDEVPETDSGLSISAMVELGKFFSVILAIIVLIIVCCCSACSCARGKRFDEEFCLDYEKGLSRPKEARPLISTVDIVVLPENYPSGCE